MDSVGFLSFSFPPPQIYTIWLLESFRCNFSIRNYIGSWQFYNKRFNMNAYTMVMANYIHENSRGYRWTAVTRNIDRTEKMSKMKYAHISTMRSKHIDSFLFIHFQFCFSFSLSLSIFSFISSAFCVCVCLSVCLCRICTLQISWTSDNFEKYISSFLYIL